MGLKFALEILATQHRPSHSPQEWADHVKSRMQQPTVTQQNYGGGTLNAIRQMTVQLSKGDRHPQTAVYIQDGASVDLLLCTDVLLLLGYLLQEPQADGPHSDLLGGGAEEQSKSPGTVITKRPGKEPVSCQPDMAQTEADDLSGSVPTGIVCLLSLTRVPPRHQASQG